MRRFARILSGFMAVLRPLYRVPGRLVVAGATLLLVLLMGAGFWWWTSQHRGVKIGILQARSHHFHDWVYRGFLERHDKVEKKCAYDIQPFYFEHGDEQSLARALSELSRWRPAVVVPVGVEAAQAVKKHAPQAFAVFVGVRFAVERGLVASLEVPGSFMTGVAEGDYDPLTMPALLIAAKPSTRRVLIPYEATHEVNGCVEGAVVQVKEFLAQHGVQADLYPIERGQVDGEELEKMLGSYDVLMTLDLDPVQALTTVFTELCPRTKTTFFAGSLDGVEVGAVLSFGGYPQVLGKAAFLQVQQIVEGGHMPGALPVIEIVSHRQFVVNMNLTARQDMPDANGGAIRRRMMRYEVTVPYIPNLKVIA